MVLHDEKSSKKDLAKEDIVAAELLLGTESYKASNNRAYYAVFHAINAIQH